jgi:hypothetical protein
MPEIRRRNLPPALLDHLLDRIRSREISPEQLGEFAQWLDTAPEVPILFPSSSCKDLGNTSRFRNTHR